MASLSVSLALQKFPECIVPRDKSSVKLTLLHVMLSMMAVIQLDFKARRKAGLAIET